MGAVACALLVFSTWNAASAAVLTLLDWTTIPVPSGTHPDRYELPYEFLFPISGKTITTVELDYRNLPMVSGEHGIQSVAFLFSPGDVFSTTVFESTSERYWARVQFKPSRVITDLSNPFSPAFVAMHGPYSTAFTSAQWTVTYTDSTTATSNNGIVPEPACAAFIAFFSTATLFRRRRSR